MDTIRVNGKEEPLLVPTIAALVADRGIAADGRGIAVACNGALVCRADWATTPLHAGDAIEIVVAKQGG